MIIGIIVAVYFVREIAIALFLAIIIASAIDPAISWMTDKRVPRLLAAILIYLFIIALLFSVFYLIVPLLYEEALHFASTYSVLRENIFEGLQQFSSFPLLSSFTDAVANVLFAPSKFLTQFQGGIFDVASAAFGGVLTVFLASIFSFYLATQARGIEDFLRLVTPLKYEDYIVDLWQRSQRKLGRWLRTQLLLGAVVGVLIFFSLTFLGMENALFFAALAAFLEIIPVVGPILAAIPAVFSAFLYDPTFAFWVILLYVAIQQIESNVIVPVIMRQAVGLSPLVVLIALAVGAKLGGVIGILLAVPVTVIVAEFISDWDKKKREFIPG
jgi:predicted PurR-regulated permease PerM